MTRQVLIVHGWSHHVKRNSTHFVQTVIPRRPGEQVFKLGSS